MVYCNTWNVERNGTWNGMEWNIERDGMEPAINKINLNIFTQHSQIDRLFVSGIHL